MICLLCDFRIWLGESRWSWDSGDYNYTVELDLKSNLLITWLLFANRWFSSLPQVFWIKHFSLRAPQRNRKLSKTSKQVVFPADTCYNYLEGHGAQNFQDFDRLLPQLQWSFWYVRLGLKPKMKKSSRRRRRRHRWPNANLGSEMTVALFRARSSRASTSCCIPRPRAISDAGQARLKPALLQYRSPKREVLFLADSDHYQHWPANWY